MDTRDVGADTAYLSLIHIPWSRTAAGFIQLIIAAARPEGALRSRLRVRERIARDEATVVTYPKLGSRRQSLAPPAMLGGEPEAVMQTPFP